MESIHVLAAGMMIDIGWQMKMGSCAYSHFFFVIFSRFPGKDYYQPARGLFRPVQNLDDVEKDDNEDDIAEFVFEEEKLDPNCAADNVSEAENYCPSEVPEEGPFSDSPNSERSFIGEEKNNPRQVYAASSQKSLKSRTEFTQAEVFNISDMLHYFNRFQLSMNLSQQSVLQKLKSHFLKNSKRRNFQQRQKKVEF